MKASDLAYLEKIGSVGIVNDKINRLKDLYGSLCGAIAVAQLRIDDHPEFEIPREINDLVISTKSLISKLEVWSSFLIDDTHELEASDIEDVLNAVHAFVDILQLKNIKSSHLHSMSERAYENWKPFMAVFPGIIFNCREKETD